MTVLFQPQIDADLAQIFLGKGGSRWLQNLCSSAVTPGGADSGPVEIHGFFHIGMKGMMDGAGERGVFEGGVLGEAGRHPNFRGQAGDFARG